MKKQWYIDRIIERSSNCLHRSNRNDIINGLGLFKLTKKQLESLAFILLKLEVVTKDVLK